MYCRIAWVIHFDQFWYHPKKWKFSNKKSDFFHISAQNIDCGYTLEPPRRSGSNDYTQSMYLNWNKKIMYAPVNPSFTVIKVGFKGVNIKGVNIKKDNTHYKQANKWELFNMKLYSNGTDQVLCKFSCLRPVPGYSGATKSRCNLEFDSSCMR